MRLLADGAILVSPDFMDSGLNWYQPAQSAAPSLWTVGRRTELSKPEDWRGPYDSPLFLKLTTQIKRIRRSVNELIRDQPTYQRKTQPCLADHYDWAYGLEFAPEFGRGFLLCVPKYSRFDRDPWLYIRNMEVAEAERTLEHILKHLEQYERI